MANLLSISFIDRLGVGGNSADYWRNLYASQRLEMVFLYEVGSTPVLTLPHANRTAPQKD